MEKSIEVTFKVPSTNAKGARAIPENRLSALLELAACTIIGRSSPDSFDAYVLSESSLFVYRDQVIAKTCGTTKLLHMLPALLEEGKCYGLEPELVVYRRKNFGFPSQQHFPHTDFAHEEQYLNDLVGGSSFIFESPSGDQWYLYVADLGRGGDRRAHSGEPASCLHAAPRGHAVLELMMHDLDPDTMSRFYRLPEYGCGRDMTHATGISTLLAGAHIDEHMFTPCGYSCNALRDDRYWTIHVTPEPHCSYVSFETNAVPADWPALVQRVCAVFRPGRCVVSLRAAADALPPRAVRALDRRGGCGVTRHICACSATRLWRVVLHPARHRRRCCCCIGRRCAVRCVCGRADLRAGC